MSTPLPRMAFIVSSPRSGSTLLERMVESHSRVLGGPEPHVLTPLAHLGFWDKADAAPYAIHDASRALHAFVGHLPEGEPAYYRAIRAYCDELYGRWLATRPDAALCLDKTPAYGLVLPFIERVYPDAAYLVLARHPLATFSSYAHSFFGGDYAAAHAYNPILERYVPALAAFVREGNARRLLVRYEDLVVEPEAVMRRVCEHLELPFEAATLTYGDQGKEPPEGLGDPIGVKQHSRPVTDSVGKWPGDLLRNPGALGLMREVIGRLDPDDLTLLGYPPDTLWGPLEAAKAAPLPPAPRHGWNRYRLQRMAIVRTRALARGFPPARAAIATLRRMCAALLPTG